MSPRTGLLGVLVPDETTRRAFEETLADWRDEWQRASSPIERIRVSTRGWMSIARLVAGTIRVGWLTAETWAVLSTAVAVSAVLSLLMTPSIWSYAPGLLSLPELIVAVLLLMPQGMTILLAPVAAIGLGTKPWREPSVIAVAPALVLTMILFTGWVYPASNQMYREYVFTNISGGPYLVLSGLAEMSGPQLIFEATGGTLHSGWPAIGHLVARLGIVVYVPLSFIFGVAVRRRLAFRTRWGIARFVAGASAMAVFLLSSTLPGTRGLSIWLSSLVLCVLIVVLARTSNQTSEPGTQEPGTSAFD